MRLLSKQQQPFNIDSHLKIGEKLKGKHKN